MGTVKKIGNEFYIEFEARGLKYQQKAGTSEDAAYALLYEIESKIRNGQMGAIVRDVDMDIFLHDFIEHARGLHTPRTIERFTDLIANFQRFLESSPVRSMLFVINSYTPV